jgi:MFS family permease
LLLPLLFKGLAAALLAAAVLGMVRAATISVRSATMAEAVPRQIRGRLQALFSISFQAAQMVGFATGAGVALLVGVRAALTADIAIFLLAALVLSRLRLPVVRSRERRRPSPPGWRPSSPIRPWRCWRRSPGSG